MTDETAPLARRARPPRSKVERPRNARRAAAKTLSPPPPEAAETPALKTPRVGSRLSLIVDLLAAPDGATMAALTAATGWQAHSVRGAIAGALKKTYGLTIVATPGETGRVYRTITPETVA